MKFAFYIQKAVQDDGQGVEQAKSSRHPCLYSDWWCRHRENRPYFL